jgi:sugar/nucleoside kinase (ribokinase family)
MKKILGIGNALVDIMVRLDNDDLLKELGLPKGSMQLIDNVFAEKLHEKITNLPKSISAGGSAANTINGLANLGVKTGFIGVVGEDKMGGFFAEDMLKNNIKPHLNLIPIKSGVATAFVTPDSERTFATFLGAAMELTAQHLDENIFKQYDIIHIEGYLVQNYDLIKGIMQKAKSCGLVVSLDLASYNVVAAHLDFIKSLVKDYVDIVFANEEEAKAFTGKEPEEALHIFADYCDISIVKIGQKGSLIKRQKDTHTIGVISANSIDSTGAGDLYASGFLFGLVNDMSMEKCGKIGALLAGKVIEVMGSKIDKSIWDAIRKNIQE